MYACQSSIGLVLNTYIVLYYKYINYRLVLYTQHYMLDFVTNNSERLYITVQNATPETYKLVIHIAILVNATFTVCTQLSRLE